MNNIFKKNTYQKSRDLIILWGDIFPNYIHKYKDDKQCLSIINLFNELILDTNSLKSVDEKKYLIILLPLILKTL